jgi:hypothetical protein
VPFHQRGKRRLGIAGCELAHQRHVIAHHFLYMAAERGIGQTNFCTVSNPGTTISFPTVRILFSGIAPRGI